MQAIVDFLALIGQAIVGIIELIISIVEDIVFVVQLGAQMLMQLPSYFAWIPAEAVTLVVTAVTIIIIYKISGRE